ncbi:uncharacterized protein LOC119104929 [Pollicipes pollicipes]|uniref:uncharacterized protein LOC119104929 n=1 Tax=Pollicipes pollicipes TaxID=41117 RepID=UPI0018853362|nr:uncharacterized protein LOC119104929 [Pollicipes pollicipes]
MADWEEEPQPSWIPHGRREVTAEWVTSLLASHLGDDICVENFCVSDSPYPSEHSELLLVDFDCSFGLPNEREVSPPASSLLDEGLVFTACVDDAVASAKERAASASDPAVSQKPCPSAPVVADDPEPSAIHEPDQPPAVQEPDHTVIRELESLALPEGADTPGDEDIQLLAVVDDDCEAAGGARRCSFYLSDSEEGEEGLLPALVTYPASGGRSPAGAGSSPTPGSQSDAEEQTAGKRFTWAVQLPPRSPFGELVSSCGLARERQLTFFSLVMPRLDGLAAANCVYCETDAGSARRWVLVTEDARRQGWTPLDPRRPLTAAAAAPVIDALASNAALFLLLKRQLAESWAPSDGRVPGAASE